jgi:hypothetical protein
MTPLLQRLLDAGVLSVLDMHFARGLARLHPDEPVADRRHHHHHHEVQ